MRVGLIYGMKNCPIKKIIILRAFGIKLILDNQNSNFSVVSAFDLANNLINVKSSVWEKQFKLAFIGEATKISIKKFIQCTKKLKIKNFFYLK